MRKRSGSWALSGLIGVMLSLLTACGNLPDSASAADIAEPGVPKQLRSRQIIVALSEKYRPQWATIAQELQTRYRLRPVGEFPLTSIGVQCLVFQAPPDQAMETLITQLRADSRVELAQVNQVFEGLRAASADPYADLAYGVRLIRANRAQRVSTGRGVAVVVIDTGADVEHPDLRGRGIQTTNFVEGGESSFPLDRHGTAVAGVIGARADGVGLDGVAPEANLSVAKACWYSEPTGAKALCSSWTLAKATDFAVNHGAKVINLSLNGRPDDLLARLLTTAHRRGIVLVAAAAEDRDDPGFPAALDGVIPVISCDVNGIASPLHWRNTAFVAVAPGQDIVAPVPQGRYALVSGSSLAAAHVSGVAALLLQRRPDLSPAQITELLQASAKPTPTVGVGIVDACAALQLAMQEPICP